MTATLAIPDNIVGDVAGPPHLNPQIASKRFSISSPGSTSMWSAHSRQPKNRPPNSDAAMSLAKEERRLGDVLDLLGIRAYIIVVLLLLLNGHAPVALW